MGTFSQIIKAYDLYNNNKIVAIKIMNEKYTQIGIQESQKLMDLNFMDSNDTTHIIRLYTTFYFQKHYCLVLEYLGESLFCKVYKFFFKIITIFRNFLHMAFH